MEVAVQLRILFDIAGGFDTGGYFRQTLDVVVGVVYDRGYGQQGIQPFLDPIGLGTFL